MPRYIVARDKKNNLFIKRDRRSWPHDKSHTDNLIHLEAKTKNHALLTAKNFFSMIDEAKKKEVGSTINQSTKTETVSKK